MTLAEIKAHIFKRTKTNATSYPASDMVVDINTAIDHCTDLVRIFLDTFRPTHVTTADLSTGTLTPWFDSLLHELVPLWVEYDYGMENDAAWTDRVFQKIEGLEARMVRFYGARNMRVCTITIAAPGVVTLNNHRFIAGQRVMFQTTGALPTGLAVDTWYYVLSTGLATDTFQLSSVKDSTAITTTGSQSGTQYVISDQGKRMGLRTNTGTVADSNK